MENKKGKEEKCEGKRINKIIIGIVSAIVLVAVVTVGIGYKKNVERKKYANNDVSEMEWNIENEAGKNGEIKTGSNGTNNENDLGIKLSNYVIAGSEEAKRSEEILKKAQEEREEKAQKEKEEIEKNKEKSKTTKYAGVSTVQLASNAGNTRDIRGAVKEIAATDISGGNLTLSQSTYEYSGQRNTPDPTVVVGGKTLMLGRDYTIAYTNNIDAGVATATVTGINEYGGTISANFTINPKSITVEWIDEGDQYEYDGTEHKPTVKTPIEVANGDRINLKVTIKEGKQAIDAGTYTTVAEIESIEPGPGPATPPGAITVTSKITTDSTGSSVAGNSVTKGTKLYIQITATQTNGTIKSIYSDYNKEKKGSTTTYNLDITDNGTYGFAIVGSENTSKWYEVEVKNYVENQIPTGLEVGDYVQYTPDNNTSAQWRVWKIDKETGEVVITPVNGIGSLTLSGATESNGWLNAETAIENECDKYISTSLGVTANNISSMKIGDIEEVMSAEEIASAKSSYSYGKEYSYNSGKFYAKEASEAEAKFDEYNTELTSPQTASSGNSVKLKSTYWYKSSPTWNKLNNTKTGMTSDTYGNILGNTYGWLASRCVYCHSSGATFAVRYVTSGYVDYASLCNSDGLTGSSSYGVRPLITLSSTLFTGEGQGTLDAPWQLAN